MDDIKTETYISNIKKIKEEQIQKILTDETLSRIEKLKIITVCQLWEPEPWIRHVFADLEKKML